MTVRGYVFAVTMLTALSTALATTVVAADRRPAGQIVQFSGGVLIKPRGQNQFRTPQPGQSFRVGDLLKVPSGSAATVQCPDGLPKNALADGITRGFAQICKTVVKSSRAVNLPYQLGNPASGSNPNSLYIISPRQTIVDGNKPTLTWNTANRSANYQVSLFQVLWMNVFSMNDVKDNQVSYPPGERNPILPAGAYRLVVEAYNNDAFLSRQEQSLTVATPPTAANKLKLAWNPVSGASHYMVSIEQQDVFWQAQASGSRITYPSKLPSGRYNLRVITNTAGGEADQQQFLVQEISNNIVESDELNEITKVNIALKKLETQLANQPLTPVGKTLASAQIFADNYMFSNAISSLLSLANNGNQTFTVYRRMGEWQQQIGLTALAKASYAKALDLAKSQGDLDEQQALQAQLVCLAEGKQCNP